MFLVDAFDCPRCHGRMRIVGGVTEPDAIERILRHLGEDPAPPCIAGPRSPPSGNEEEIAERLLDLSEPDPGEGASC